MNLIPEVVSHRSPTHVSRNESVNEQLLEMQDLLNEIKNDLINLRKEYREAYSKIDHKLQLMEMNKNGS